MLAQAQAPTGTERVDVVADAGGTLNRAGVDPVQWAKDFLTRLGAPVTASNVQAITAWEQAEGTKAAFNPLATTQGGFAGETQFNSVGVKNFASYQDGIDANVKVITNGLYRNILAALQQGNDAMAVAQAIDELAVGHGRRRRARAQLAVTPLPGGNPSPADRMPPSGSGGMRRRPISPRGAEHGRALRERRNRHRTRARARPRRLLE